ncbi:MAG TPA: YciI family protein [Anaerolineales bacterium]|nr:YciI family protein [Anaerolineales bacterium]
MAEFIYLIHPMRDEFFDNPSENEVVAMQEHYNYLKAGVKSGQVVIAGPCMDNSFGLVIFKAENENAANAFMMADPSIKKNIMIAELHPFKVSLIQQ